MPKSVLFDKNEVLEKVTYLFWEKGYNGTSMQDLVNATGLNRSSFYNTFKGGKLELFVEALKHYQSTQNQFVESFRKTTETPKEVIVSLFESIQRDVHEGNVKGCFLANCTTELANLDENIFSFLADNMTNIIKLFKSLVEEGQAIGEIDKNKDPEVLAQYLFSSLQGLRITSMIDKNPQHLKNITAQVLEAL